MDQPHSILIAGKSSQQSVIHVKANCDDVNFIEHVQAHVTLGASKRGDVQISLTSPKGTRSLLIAKRPKDYSRAGFNDWPFLTVNVIIVLRKLGCFDFHRFGSSAFVIEICELAL